MFDFEPVRDPSPPRPTWTRGNSAGGAFTKDGDLWTAVWVTTPKGNSMILVTYCGFRDTPEGRQKVILDRWVEKPPKIPRPSPPAL